MKNTVKNLINQVKKALSNKTSFAAFEQAYADEHGNLLARSLKDNADILVFIGGIIEDMNATNKMYSKDALTLAADTGVFKGGTEVPEHYTDVFTIPDGNFIPVCEISADDLKAAAYTASKDDTRPVLTGINITPDGIIQTCDGFRAYRKKCNPLHHEALTNFEKEHGFILSAAAASYGFKGLINISLSGTHIKLEDTAGLVLYVRKLEGQFVNMESIYKMDNKPTNTAKIKAVKELTSVLKTAKAAQSKAEGNRRGIFIRVREGAIDYFIPALDIYGTIEAETEINTRDTVVLLNPSFLYDAIANQGGTLLEVQNEPYKPAFIRNGANRFEMNGDTLVLPIRHDDPAPFEKYDHDRTMEKQHKQWEEIKARHPEEQEAEATPAPVATATDTEQEATTDKKQFFETPAATVRDYTADEKEALKRINDRQNAAGRFENITAEDVKKEAEKIAAERQEAEQEAAAPVEKLEIVKREEITPPEVVKARRFYSQMKSCHFKPTAIQEAEAETIYKLNREQLQPIARQAGNLYIDTLSIIAAIMSVYDN